MKKKDSTVTKRISPAEKPVSLAPLTETQALRGLLAVKTIKGEQVKKGSKKRTAKKAAIK